MNELIRKKDALDALMAERKHLLASGQKGAEHILTHHGYNVIDELQPVQSDVPDIYAGELISRRAATTIPVMPKEHRHYQTNNLDDAYEQGWTDLQECIENLPLIQPKRGRWMIEPTEEPEYCKCSECGYVNLIVEVFSLDGYHYCPNCGVKMERNEDGTD